MVKKPNTRIGSLIMQLVDAQEILKTGKTALTCCMFIKLQNTVQILSLNFPWRTESMYSIYEVTEKTHILICPYNTFNKPSSKPHSLFYYNLDYCVQNSVNLLYAELVTYSMR